MVSMTCPNPDCARGGIPVDLTQPVDLETGAPIPLNVVVCGFCSTQLVDVDTPA